MEEKKTNVIPLVIANEQGEAQHQTDWQQSECSGKLTSDETKLFKFNLTVTPSYNR